MGSVCEVAIFTDLLFYPMFTGVPKWFTVLPVQREGSQPRIAHVKAQLFLALALAAATSESADAHHSLVASYRLDMTVVIEGTLAQFLFRNPHSFVQIKVADQAGRIEIRTVEWGSGGQLSRAGVSRDTLKPGDHVIVTGNPSRNPAEHMLRMVSILRPLDGWRWNEEN